MHRVLFSKVTSLCCCVLKKHFVVTTVTRNQLPAVEPWSTGQVEQEVSMLLLMLTYHEQYPEGLVRSQAEAE